MSESESQSRRPMGRPRTFNMDSVLAHAVPVFRERGYERASIDCLKAATGLTAGSLYKAFKDKEAFFSAALSRYLVDRHKQLSERLSCLATGRERIAETLRFYLDSASGAEGRRGCLILASLIEATTLDCSLQVTLSETLKQNRAALTALLRSGQDDGSIRGDLAIEPLADLLLSLLQGIRAVGKLRDPEDHDALVATALRLLD